MRVNFFVAELTKKIAKTTLAEGEAGSGDEIRDKKRKAMTFSEEYDFKGHQFL